MCKDVLVGIGDDCVVVKVFENQYLVVIIDMLIVGVYFFFDVLV